MEGLSQNLGLARRQVTFVEDIETVSAHQHHLCVRKPPRNFSVDLTAAFLGHNNIEKYEVYIPRLAVQYLRRFFPVFREEYAVAGARQNTFRKVAHLVIVFGNQNGLIVAL